MMTNPILILAIVFLIIAVIGESKLLFLEIKPGCFGRLLALGIAVFCFYLSQPAINLQVGNFSNFHFESLQQLSQNAISYFQNMIQQVNLFD